MFLFHLLLVLWQLHTSAPFASASASESRSGSRVLVAFMAAGANRNRNLNLKQQVERFFPKTATPTSKLNRTASTDSTNRDKAPRSYDCLIFSYQPDPPGLHSFLKRYTPEPCKYLERPGWKLTHWCHYLSPTFLHRKNYDYLFMMLDDIRYDCFHLDKFMDVMAYNRLSLATPRILTSGYKLMKERLPPAMRTNALPAGQVAAGYRHNMLELQAWVVRRDVWSCWWETFDVRIPGDWGHDMWLYEYCRRRVDLRIGTVDLYTAGAIDDRTTSDKSYASWAMHEQPRLWQKDGNHSAPLTIARWDLDWAQVDKLTWPKDRLEELGRCAANGARDALRKKHKRGYRSFLTRVWGRLSTLNT